VDERIDKGAQRMKLQKVLLLQKTSLLRTILIILFFSFISLFMASAAFCGKTTASSAASKGKEVFLYYTGNTIGTLNPCPG
jgi:ABC-type oligopeptide transport system substrate-binding subunit